MTAYLSLDFTQSVKIPEVLSVLKTAADGNGFGDLQVDPGSIQAISDEQLPTDSITQGPSSTVGSTTSGTVRESFVSPVFCFCFCFFAFFFFFFFAFFVF